jgi:hypothetical protein
VPASVPPALDGDALVRLQRLQQVRGDDVAAEAQLDVEIVGRRRVEGLERHRLVARIGQAQLQRLPFVGPLHIEDRLVVVVAHGVELDL